MLTSVEPYQTYEEMITDTNRIIANIRYWQENFLEYFQSDGEVTNPGKNLALTLKQVVKLDNIIMNMVGEGYNDGYKTRPFYEEVSKRFNEQKKK